MKNCAGSDQRTLKSGTLWKYLLNPTICSFWRGWINVLFWVFGGGGFFSPQIKGKLHTKLCTCSYSQHEYTLTFVSLCDRFAAIV